MTPNAADYTSQVHINASSERVFDTLTTLASFASWWAPAADSGAGEVHVNFAGLDDPLIFQVEEAERPSRLSWTITSSPYLPRLGRHYAHVHPDAGRPGRMRPGVPAQGTALGS